MQLVLLWLIVANSRLCSIGALRPWIKRHRTRVEWDGMWAVMYAF